MNIEIREAAQWCELPQLKREDCETVLAMRTWDHLYASCFLRGFDTRGLLLVEGSIKCDIGIFEFLNRVVLDAIEHKDYTNFGSIAWKAGKQYVHAPPSEWLSWAEKNDLLAEPWITYLSQNRAQPEWIFAQKNEREWLIGPIEDPVLIARKPHSSPRGIDLLQIVLSNPVQDGFDGYDAVTMEAHLTRAAFATIDDNHVSEMHDLGFSEEVGLSVLDEMSSEELAQYRQRLTDQLTTLERKRSELETQKEQYEDVAQDLGLELGESSAPQGITFRDITVQYQDIIDQLASMDTDMEFYRKELNEYSPHFSGKKRHKGRHNAYNATWTKIRNERDNLASERGLEEFGAYLKETVSIQQRMIGYRPPSPQPVIQFAITRSESQQT